MHGITRQSGLTEQAHPLSDDKNSEAALASVTFSDDLFRQCLGKPLAVLADDYHQRGQWLQDQGWVSFLPLQKFDKEYRQSLCSDIEIAAHAQIMLYVRRWHLSLHTYQNRYVMDLFQAAKERSEKDNYAPETAYTECQRKMHQEYLINIAAVFNAYQPYLTKYHELLRQEVNLHHNQVGHYLLYKPDDRVTLYRTIMDRYAPELGFTFHESLSTAMTPVYTKPLIGPWQFLLLMDSSQLHQRDAFGEGQLVLNVGIVKSEEHKAKSYRYFSLTEFFPIQYTYTTLMSAYRSFKTLAEMETLVIANIQMYKMIQHDFESAIVNGFKAFLSLHCHG